MAALCRLISRHAGSAADAQWSAGSDASLLVGWVAAVSLGVRVLNVLMREQREIRVEGEAR